MSQGARGADVLAVHELLRRVGFDIAGDMYGDDTVHAVSAFQRSALLPVTGALDPFTAQQLRQYQFDLGDRLLYRQDPPLVGHDVAELQASLAQLGFDPGTVDGLFGTETEHALRDFQLNCGLEPSGTVTRATLTELRRLRPSVPKVTVSEARESGLLQARIAGPLVAMGGYLATAMADTWSSYGLSLSAPDENELIETANSEHASLAVWIEISATPAVSYVAGPHSFSTTGLTLATQLATKLSCAVRGVDENFLRRTKMTALILSVTNDFDAMKVCAELSEALSFGN